MDNIVSKQVNELIDKLYKIKNLDVKADTKENGEVTVLWEIMGPPKSNKSELDIFKENFEYIQEADNIILEIAKIMDSNDITYSFKLCKSLKLETNQNIPILLTSYISFDFPKTEYYMNKVHEDIPDAMVEFENRKTLFS